MENEARLNMRLTMRDQELLAWINAVGFVTIAQLALMLKVSIPTAYIRAQKLTQNGYLTHDRIFHSAPGIYRVTPIGVQVSGSELPPVRTLSLATYRHDLLVTSLSFELCSQYNGRFTTERELRHAGRIKNSGSSHSLKTEHTPDGVLIFNDKRVAIEVELSQKSTRRLDSIYHFYLGNFDYNEVWYFCGSEGVKAQIENCFNHSAFLKAMMLSDIAQPVTTQPLTPTLKCDSNE